MECFGCLATFADLLILATKLPEDFARGARRESLRKFADLREPAAADRRIAGHAGQKLLDVVPLLRHIGESLDIAGRWIGKLTAGLAARLQGDAAHHFAPAAVLRQAIDKQGQANIPRG